MEEFLAERPSASLFTHRRKLRKRPFRGRGQVGPYTEFSRIVSGTPCKRQCESKNHSSSKLFRRILTVTKPVNPFNIAERHQQSCTPDKKRSLKDSFVRLCFRGQ